MKQLILTTLALCLTSVALGQDANFGNVTCQIPGQTITYNPGNPWVDPLIPGPPPGCNVTGETTSTFTARAIAEPGQGQTSCKVSLSYASTTPKGHYISVEMAYRPSGSTGPWSINPEFSFSAINGSTNYQVMLVGTITLNGSEGSDVVPVQIIMTRLGGNGDCLLISF